MKILKNVVSFLVVATMLLLMGMTDCPGCGQIIGHDADCICQER